MVKDHFAKTGNEIREIVTLSNGAVALVDRFYDLGIYFDAEKYTLTKKSNRSIEPEIFKLKEGFKLGYLSQVSRLPKLLTYEDTLDFAKMNLQPLDENAEFYKSPDKSLIDRTH